VLACVRACVRARVRARARARVRARVRVRVRVCVCVLFAAFFSCGHLIGEIKVLMSYCTVIMLYRYIIRHEMFVINCHND